ncbi:type II secretion system F family protein, partial [Halomonas sp. SIMBA_159]
SVALAAHRGVFPPIMISLVRASEASGTMGPMLERVSSYLAKEAQTRRTVRGALTYPAVMMSMVLLVTVFLLAFVMP